jgi:hypothetical protein
VTTGSVSEDEIEVGLNPDGPGAGVLDPVLTRLGTATAVLGLLEPPALAGVVEVPAEVTFPERT